MAGIYIPDMQMPKSCHECVFGRYEVCGINTEIEGKDAVTHHCPLIAVPDHGRLGDLDALAKKCDEPNWCVWLNEIEDAPTIIPADKEDASDAEKG